MMGIKISLDRATEAVLKREPGYQVERYLDDINSVLLTEDVPGGHNHLQLQQMEDGTVEANGEPFHVWLNRNEDPDYEPPDGEEAYYNGHTCWLERNI